MILRPGEGLFETLRVDDGTAWEVGLHLDRLLAGLDRIGLQIEENRASLEAAIATAAETAPRPIARLRLTVTHEEESPPIRRIETFLYRPPSGEDYARGVDVVLLAGSTDPRLDSRDPWVGLKRLPWEPNRTALRQAEAAGAFEGLLLNERGQLVEGCRSSLVLVIDGEAFTPQLSDGCLPGTVRRRLLEAGAIQERSLGPEQLAQSQEVLLTNSLVGVIPARRCDRQELSPGHSAPRLSAVAGFEPIPTTAGS